MSKLSNLIFKDEKHYVTSKFGYRKSFNTKAGSTSSFHNGTDYGTSGKKIAQYAIENGTILSCGTDSLGGKYAWIKYPRLNVKMLHYHLDSVSCKTGQAVSKGTLIGYTGMTGRATGIHLHLGIVNLANGQYIDPEAYNYSEPTVEVKSGFLPAKDYFGPGDVHANIGKIAEFMRRVFPKYTSEKALGNTYGPYIKSSITTFQTNAKKDGRYNNTIDGLFGPDTLKALESYGFRY